ncbi:MAG TPA: hypothetical protein VFW50_19745 [Streptosporangiaceae bacterium]|nr:hypothetical protein [Streptosporangiaceae bacterium]
MPDPKIQALERDAARHWQAPGTEPLGEWLLRAADGFTGRPTPPCRWATPAARCPPP